MPRALIVAPSPDIQTMALKAAQEAGFSDITIQTPKSAIELCIPENAGRFHAGIIEILGTDYSLVRQMRDNWVRTVVLVLIPDEKLIHEAWAGGGQEIVPLNQCPAHCLDRFKELHRISSRREAEDSELLQES